MTVFDVKFDASIRNLFSKRERMLRMKKIILPVIFCFLMIMMNNQAFASTAKVNVTAVRIRESASTDSNIVISIYQEDEVEILEEKEGWYKVKYGESVGYAKAEFFEETTENEANTTTNETTTKENVTNEIENEVIPEENTVNQENATSQGWNVGESIPLVNAVKIRIMPSLSATEKNEIAQSKSITIEKELGNWYKITDGQISGWVLQSKMKEAKQTETKPVSEPEQQPVPAPTQPEPQNKIQEQKKEENKKTSSVNKTAIVIVETARVRKKASKDADIIDVLDEDAIVTITGEEGDFYKITSNKIGSGYISKSLVKEKDVSSRSSIEERENVVNDEANQALNQSLAKATNASVTGNDIVQFSKQFLGYPYVLGASLPEKGFDCSGFTRYVFGHFGFTLGQVAASQTSLGSVVERENLQVGDLILFYNDGKTKIGHCGIYIGGGDFIHSANAQRGVVIDNLNTNSYYAQRFVTARRIVF